MQTNELIQAAASIASGMVHSATRGQIEPADMQTIARTSVELAKLIEDAARKAYSPH